MWPESPITARSSPRPPQRQITRPGTEAGQPEDRGGQSGFVRPEDQPSYAELAAHYGCLIDPAREVKARDSPMMENTIGLYKTELIKPRGPWRSLAEVELATAEYVDGYNNKRLRTAIGGMPLVEHEAAYYAQTQPQPVAGPKT